jgi:hypothetical protein
VKSRAGYWIGGALIAVGIVGAVLWFVGSLMSLSDEVDGFQRVPIPGEGTVRLDARKYVLYYEGSGADESVPVFTVEIADARTGAPLQIANYGGSLTYAFSDHEGSAQGTVTPPRAGRYAVRTTGGGRIGENLAFGRSIAAPILRGILGTVAIGLALVGAGVTMVVITGIRRSRAKRAAATDGLVRMPP